jgi:hypothetical protein
VTLLWLAPFAGFATGIVAENTRAYLQPVGNRAYEWLDRIRTGRHILDALLFLALFSLDALIFIGKQVPLLLVVMGSTYTVTGVSAHDLVRRTHAWSSSDVVRGVIWLALLIVGYRISKMVRSRWRRTSDSSQAQID